MFDSALLVSYISEFGLNPNFRDRCDAQILVGGTLG
jgi:hypothetical protein